MSGKKNKNKYSEREEVKKKLEEMERKINELIERAEKIIGERGD